MTQIVSHLGLILLSWYLITLQVRSTHSHSYSFLSFSYLAGTQFADCMTCLTIQRISFPFEHNCIFTSPYMNELVTWWTAHGLLSRATQIVPNLVRVLLSWCITAFKQVRSSNSHLFVLNTLISVL